MVRIYGFGMRRAGTRAKVGFGMSGPSVLEEGFT